MYETVALVYWSNESCSAKLDPEKDPPDFPSLVIFDLEAPSSKPALTFYSRLHIETVTIPGLSKSIYDMKIMLAKVEAKEKICCTVGKGSCETEKTVRICDEDDLAWEEEAYQVLQGSLASWKSSLAKTIADKAKDVAEGLGIVDWFTDDDVGQKGMHQEEHNTGNMAIKDFNVNLAPDTLIQDAKLTETGKVILGTTDEEQAREKILQTKRIQFSGSSGAYELSLDKTRYYYSAAEDCNQNTSSQIGMAVMLAGAKTGLGLATLPLVAGSMVIGSAIAGCNYEIDPDIAIGDVDAMGKVFGIGVKGQIGAGKSIFRTTGNSIY
jgi:hypothetical protein